MAQQYSAHYGSGNQGVQASRIESSVSHIHEQSERSESLQNQCLQSLATPHIRYRAGLREKTPGTCDWILHHESYKRWLDSGGILYVEGESGTGKSMLMLDLVQKAKRAGRAQVLSFFFMAGTEWQESMLAMLHALLHQILSLDEVALSEFLAISDFDGRCKREGRPGDSARSWNWTELELKKHFEAMTLDAARRCHVTLFVDALDESHDAPFVWDYLKGIANVQKFGISVCVSSRPDTGVERALTRHINLKSGNLQDIQIHVARRLRTELSEETVLPLVAELSGRCQGTFRWAAIAAEQLLTMQRDFGGYPLPVGKLLEGLSELPSGLPALYDTLLAGLSVHDSRIVLKLFSWVAKAAQPLTCEQLKVAMALRLKVDIYSAIEASMNARDLPDAVGKWKEEVKRLSFELLTFNDVPTHVRRYQLKHSYYRLRNAYLANHELSLALLEEVSHRVRWEDKEEVESLASFTHESVREYLLGGGLQKLQSKAMTGLEWSGPFYSHSYIGITLLATEFTENELELMYEEPWPYPYCCQVHDYDTIRPHICKEAVRKFQRWSLSLEPSFTTGDHPFALLPLREYACSHILHHAQHDEDEGLIRDLFLAKLMSSLHDYWMNTFYLDSQLYNREHMYYTCELKFKHTGLLSWLRNRFDAQYLRLELQIHDSHKWSTKTRLNIWSVGGKVKLILHAAALTGNFRAVYTLLRIGFPVAERDANNLTAGEVASTNNIRGLIRQSGNMSTLRIGSFDKDILLQAYGIINELQDLQLMFDGVDGLKEVLCAGDG